MNLIAEKARFYHELSRFLSSGFGVREGLEAILEETPRGRWKNALSASQRELDQGQSLAKSFRKGGAGLFEELELATLEAGERSGFLDSVCGFLATYYDAIRSTRAEIKRRSMYPLFLVHFGVITLWTPSIFLGGAGFDGYLVRVGVTFAILYGLFFLFAGLGKWFWKSGAKSVGPDRILRAVPLFGRVRRTMAMARFCSAWQIQIQAGLPIIEALDAAAKTSGSALIVHSARGVIPLLQSGGQLSSAIESVKGLTPLVRRAVQTGERTGELDLELGKCAKLYHEESRAAMVSLATWIPKLIFLGIAIGLAVMIVQAYLQIFEGYSQLLDF